MRALLQRGIDTYLIAPMGPYIKNVTDLGVKHIKINVSRFLNPFADLKFFIRLYLIFRRERFDIVHNFSIKPNTYGALAGRFAGVGRILGSVTGLGYLFTNRRGGLKTAILRILAQHMYRLGFRYTDKIWFQNKDDVNEFLSAGLINHDKVVLIKSSGVDMEEFSAVAVDKQALESLRHTLALEGTNIVTMVARPLWNKGIREFVEASEFLKGNMANALFIVVGEKEPGNPDNVPDEYIKKNESERLRFVGWRDDIREIFAISSVVVLPSYREGMPKSLIEAMAMGKPLVTTDCPGCRETVENGKNGILVPAGDSMKLAEAIQGILKDESIMMKYGRYSRQKAEREFDERNVVRRLIGDVYQL